MSRIPLHWKPGDRASLTVRVKNVEDGLVLCEIYEGDRRTGYLTVVPEFVLELVPLPKEEP